MKMGLKKTPNFSGLSSKILVVRVGLI